MAPSISFPFHFDGMGRTAFAASEDHVREMIEQLLFTSPGERVNNPNFGCGLLQLPFEPNSDQLQQTTEFLIRASLSQWLGDVIDVQSIVVSRDDSTFSVQVNYIIRRTQQQQLATFERTV
jgi:phage baseplate assembly protein W